MCLDIVHQKYGEPGIGYKVFCLDRYNGLIGLYRDNIHYDRVNLNVDKNEGSIDATNGDFYETGFHIYMEAGAHIYEYIDSLYHFSGKNPYVVYKVSYDKVTAIGFDCGYPTVVAREFKIIEEII